MSVHCLESGCIGKYTHLGPRDFPRVGILHPSALALGKSLGPRGVHFPIHPSSRQCTDTMLQITHNSTQLLCLFIWSEERLQLEVILHFNVFFLLIYSLLGLNPAFWQESLFFKQGQIDETVALQKMSASLASKCTREYFWLQEPTAMLHEVS